MFDVQCHDTPDLLPMNAESHTESEVTGPVPVQPEDVAFVFDRYRVCLWRWSSTPGGCELLNES